MRSLAYILLSVLALISWNAAGAAEIAEPELIGDSVTIELGEPAARMCSGGRGRYLIFHLKQAKKLAVFDVSAAKIVRSLDMPADDARFAASEEKLLVALPGQKLLHRYSLDTLEREKTVQLVGDADVKLAVLGAGSAGPLLLWSNGKAVLWDIADMKPLILKGEMIGGSAQYGCDIRVSNDGQTFTTWTTQISSQHYTLIRLGRQAATTYTSPDSFSENGRFAQPTADGTRVLRNGGLYNGEMKPIPSDGLRGWVLAPCEDPRFFLAIRRMQNPKQSEVAIGTLSDLRLLHTVSNLQTMTGEHSMLEWGYYHDEPRVHWLPSARVLVVFPLNNDRVVLYPFNLREELDQLADGYLFVVSKPPEQVLTGDIFTYPLEVWSSSDKLKFKLESGPEGMTIDDKGEIRWPVKTKPIGGVASVVVSVGAGAGKETFHAFELTVIRTNKREPPDSNSPANPPAANEQPKADAEPPAKPEAKPDPKPAGAEPAADAEADAALVEPGRVELPSATARISPGLDGRLLVYGDERLTVLGSDGMSIEARRPLPTAYTHLIERGGYWVGLAKKPHSVDIIDKATQKVTKSFALSATELMDLAPHPTLPISYISLKNFGDLPHFKFIVFDETTAKADEGADLFGNWLAVTPDGKYLLTAYSDIYEHGARIIFNPDRIHIVPDYGSLDWLVRYRLDSHGAPGVDALKEQVGGNGRGLRLSADGSRVSYLSVVGSPAFSGNLAGWDPYNFGKAPVSYATKDRATTAELAFHPWLPLAATLGEKEPVFFHRETGAVEDQRLKSPPESYGDKLHRVYFSPDGKHLLVRSSVNDVHYLLQVQLHMKAGEHIKPPAKPRPVRQPASKGQLET